MKTLYQITSTVKHGKKIGRKLGFPTANIDLPESCPLSNGVYVAGLSIENDSTIYMAAVNIGKHPSFPEGEPSIEAYVLDADIDLYLKTIHLYFYKKIRDEIVFHDKTQLIFQINNDIAFVRDYFSLHAI